MRLGVSVLIVGALFIAAVTVVESQAPSCQVQLLTSEKEVIELRAAVAQLNLRLLEVQHAQKSMQLQQARDAEDKK